MLKNISNIVNIASIDRNLPGVKKYFFKNEKQNSILTADFLITNRLDNTKWIGVFQLGWHHPSGYELISCPNEYNFILACGGVGFFCDVLYPENYQVIPVTPIIAHKSYAVEMVMLLNDHTRVCCIDKNGILWTSKRISFDGISNLRINGDLVEGTGFDPQKEEQDFTFKIELQTGNIIVGIDELKEIPVSSHKDIPGLF